MIRREFLTAAGLGCLAPVGATLAKLFKRRTATRSEHPLGDQEPTPAIAAGETIRTEIT